MLQPCPLRVPVKPFSVTDVGLPVIRSDLLVSAMLCLCLVAVAAHMVILREIFQLRNRENGSLLNKVLCVAKG